MRLVHFTSAALIAIAAVAFATAVNAAPGDGPKGNKGGGNQGGDKPRGNQGAPRVQLPATPNVQVAPQQPKVKVAPQTPKVQVAPQTPKVQVAPQAPGNVVPNNAVPRVRVPNGGPNNSNNPVTNQLRGPQQRQPGNPNLPGVPGLGQGQGNLPKNPLGQPRPNDVTPPAIGGTTPALPNVPRGPNTQPRPDVNRPNVTLDPNRVTPDVRTRVDVDVRNRGPNRDGNNNNVAGGRNDFRPNYPNHTWYRGHWNGTPGGPNNPQFSNNARINGNFNQGQGGYGYGGYGYGYGGNGSNFGIGGRSSLGTLLGIGLALSGYGNGGLGLGYGNNYGSNYGGYGMVGGYPAGWGYGGYGLGRIAYSSGYLPYSNPYYVQGGGYNYSQPIPVALAVNAVPTDSQLFDAAVAQFKSGDYGMALTSIDKAIQQNSSDPAMHEFRALVLFAKADFRNSAATIHSVLAVGPGWNWATLSSLYDNIDVYTGQLRTLEQASSAQPDQADLRFLLAYHYLATENNQVEAVDQLRNVVKLNPKDRLAADLLQMNDVSQTAQAAPQANSPATEAAPAPKAVDPAALVGQWSAQRGDDSKFVFKLASDKTFTWKVEQQGRTETLTGTYDVDKDLLALEDDKSGGMIGHVSQSDNDQFTFKLLGAPKDDAGLTFKKE